MMQLYWSPRSRSFSAIWLMEETGLPYERVLTDITTGAQKAPEFLAINPMGKVPALKDGDAALGEAAAICGYVADRYPQTRLAPGPADPKRARYLQWLFFSPSCLEPALIQIFTKIEVPSTTAAWGSATQVFDVLDTARREDRGGISVAHSSEARRPMVTSALPAAASRRRCNRNRRSGFRR